MAGWLAQFHDKYDNQMPLVVKPVKRFFNFRQGQSVSQSVKSVVLGFKIEISFFLDLRYYLTYRTRTMAITVSTSF